MKTNHSNYLRLAFNIAKVNIGKTKNNPSVGCVVVKNESVISSGITSINGRPHAENNALRKDINFKDATLYSTMEPCTHFGQTPPCTKIIKKKNIKKVVYSFDDLDTRTSKKLKKDLSRKKIKTKKVFLKDFKNFYDSYFRIHNNIFPYIDAKIALSKDYYTINKQSRWITNSYSRMRAHLIRSNYDCIISTSKSINKDNSLLNCRLNGFNQSKPDLVIIDLSLKINKELKVFKLKKKRKIFIVTSNKKNKKISLLKKQGIKLIFIESLKTKKDFLSLLKILKKFNFNRILVESGLTFTNFLISNKIIHNLYIFRSSHKLDFMGYNNASTKHLKNVVLSNKIRVNLKGDNLYKIKIK